MLPLLLALTSLAAAAEKPLVLGDPLPRLQSLYLTKRKAVLPDDAKGRWALLLFGFSYQSRSQVEAWAKEFDRKFKGNPKATFYEVPMIGGLARMGAPFIESGMRKGTPKEKHENVITVYGGIAPWKKMLNVTKEDTAYVVLIDPNGVVRYITSGSYSQPVFAQMTDLVMSTGDAGF